MTENTRKLLLYLQPIRAYWKLSEQKSTIVQSRIGLYPTQLAPRLLQGHYDAFDENGIPVVRDITGDFVSHWTTICSYALANWELYLCSGEEVYKAKVIDVANFLLNNYVEREDVAIFLLYDDARKVSGITCAMNQGEAMSLLIRAHELTGESRYLNLAKRASRAFLYDYGDTGVTGKIPETDIVWYLEAGKYILNGHIYAVWGLWELAKYTDDNQIEELFETGWKSVEKAITMFDTGYWSWYWLDNPLYIASIMYHNLHIVQLEHLAGVSGSHVILEFCRKFERYACSPLNRFKSGYRLYLSKAKN